MDSTSEITDRAKPKELSTYQCQIPKSSASYGFHTPGHPTECMDFVCLDFFLTLRIVMFSLFVLG